MFSHCLAVFPYLLDLVYVAIVLKGTDILLQHSHTTDHDQWVYLLVCTCLTGLFAVIDIVCNVIKDFANMDAKSLVRMRILLYTYFMSSVLYMMIRGFILYWHQLGCDTSMSDMCLLSKFFTWGSFNITVIFFIIFITFMLHISRRNQFCEFWINFCMCRIPYKTCIDEDEGLEYYNV